MTAAAPLAAARVLCRLIEADDLPKVIAFLLAGFSGRTERYWQTGFARHAARPLPPDLPRYGYLLERGPDILGVLLTLYHAPPGQPPRCNLSSWCVQPDARLYAPLLDSTATRRPDVTYVNVSPAPSTWPLLERRGYERFCHGQIIAVPALGRARPGVHARCVDPDDDLAELEPDDRQIVRDHLAYGCVGLVCTDAAGSRPLVFRQRVVGLVPNRKSFGRVPCLQLVFCHGTEDLARYAAPAGRALLRRTKIPFVVCDAAGPMPGLPGRFFRNRAVKYARGPVPPRLGDLAYTELVIFGP